MSEPIQNRYDFVILFDVFRDLAQSIGGNSAVQVIQHIVMRPEDRCGSVFVNKRCCFSVKIKLHRLCILK